MLGPLLHPPGADVRSVSIESGRQGAALGDSRFRDNYEGRSAVEDSKQLLRIHWVWRASRVLAVNHASKRSWSRGWLGGGMWLDRSPEPCPDPEIRYVTTIGAASLMVERRKAIVACARRVFNHAA